MNVQAENKPERNPDGTLKPGNTANPHGRPKGTFSLAVMLRKKLQEVDTEDPEDQRTFAEKLIAATMRDALSGDTQSRKLCWQYIDGNPRQSVEVSGPNGGPVEVDVAEVVRDYRGAIEDAIGECD